RAIGARKRKRITNETTYQQVHRRFAVSLPRRAICLQDDTCGILRRFRPIGQASEIAKIWPKSPTLLLPLVASG
ncbi:MAG: hypothetical protein ABSD48_15120, partial [Armatimonadota bacterium]